MFLEPRLPGRHAFSFLLAPFACGKGVPGRSSRTGLAAKEYSEISIVRAHDLSFLLCIAELKSVTCDSRRSAKQRIACSYTHYDEARAPKSTILEAVPAASSATIGGSRPPPA